MSKMENKKSVGYRIGEALGALVVAFIISIIIITAMILISGVFKFLIGISGVAFTLPFYIVLFGVWVLLLKTWK